MLTHLFEDRRRQNVRPVRSQLAAEVRGAGADKFFTRYRTTLGAPGQNTGRSSLTSRYARRSSTAFSSSRGSRPHSAQTSGASGSGTEATRGEVGPA